METVIGPYRIFRKGFSIKVFKRNLVFIQRTFNTLEEAESYFKLMLDVARFLEE